MLISYEGEARWPDKITPYQLPPAPAPKEEEAELTEEEKMALVNEQQKKDFLKNTGLASIAAAALLYLGVSADSPDSIQIASTFALAGLAGYQVVWGGCSSSSLSINGSYECNFGNDRAWRYGSFGPRK